MEDPGKMQIGDRGFTKGEVGTYTCIKRKGTERRKFTGKSEKVPSMGGVFSSHQGERETKPKVTGDGGGGKVPRKKGTTNLT